MLTKEAPTSFRFFTEFTLNEVSVFKMTTFKKMNPKKAPRKPTGNFRLSRILSRHCYKISGSHLSWTSVRFHLRKICLLVLSFSIQHFFIFQIVINIHVKANIIANDGYRAAHAAAYQGIGYALVL